MSKLLLFFLLFIILFISSVILSKIRINIISSQFFDEKNRGQNYYDFKIIIILYLFYKIKIIKFTINKQNVEKYKFLGKNPKNAIKMDRKILKIIKRFKFNIEKIDLDLKFDTKDINITTILTIIAATIISSIMLKYANNQKKESYKYKIQPNYQEKNYINFKLKCIISINFVHIINILYKIIKKERSDKNERTSNRRSYGYCNE